MNNLFLNRLLATDASTGTLAPVFGLLLRPASAVPAAQTDGGR